MAGPSDPTTLLAEIRDGKQESVEELFPVVYEELRRLARSQLRRGRAPETLNSSALVHEAYMRLIDQARVAWRDEAHFCAIAARCMRQVIVDYARHKGAQKRGGDVSIVRLDGHDVTEEAGVALLLDIDRALDRLTEKDFIMARVVECRFFGGMTVEETSVVLDVSPRTVERAWTRAKAYLSYMLKDQSSSHSAN